MNIQKQIRWTAITTLILGIGFAAISGWIERETANSAQINFADSGTAMASKLFTLAAVFILIWGIEWQRARTSAHLQKLEDEIAELKGSKPAVA